ncbi:hypothetical protein [Nocardioides sp.]|uniref:hypothetical protein n=1 Tax=Nocardioides sp. TaxID=35761 RepID=UPI0035AFF6BB
MNISENKRRHLAMLLDVQRRDDGTTHKGLLDHQLVEGMNELVELTGIPEQVAKWREPARGLGGRPSVYGEDRDRFLFVIMLCLLRIGDSPQLIEIADVICNRLAARTRALLGLPVDNGRASKTAVYHRVLRAWHRFTDVCDPFPGATHMRKTRAEVEQIVARYDPELVKLKKARLNWIQNALLEATWNLLDEETRADWSGNIVMDSTPIFVWGKNGHNSQKKKPTDRMSPEFMVDWHFMHNDPMAWAYSLHIAATGPDPYRECRHPVLAIAASMNTHAKEVGKEFAGLLHSIVDRGHQPNYAIADRGILGHALAKDLNRPLIELGYKPVMDYKKSTKKHEGSIQGTQRGAIYVDGTPFCPSTPTELVEARADYERTGDWQTLRDRIARRSLYRFRKKGGDAWFCPAMGGSATAVCPARPEGPLSLGMPTIREHAVVLGPPPADERPDCCTGGQVSLPAAGTAAEKYLQPLLYKSQKWEDHYDTRTLIEGYNGYIKTPKKERTADASQRRVRGFAANALVAVLCLTAANIRKIERFYKDGESPVGEPRPKPTKNGYTRPPAWVRAGKRHPHNKQAPPGVGLPDQPVPDAA